MRGPLLGLLVGVLLLGTSCSDDPAESAPVEVSTECETAMAVAANEPDSAKANPLIVATLDDCQSADEWLDALRLHPGALGMTTRAEIDRTQLLSVCSFGNARTTVCRDAVSEGIVSASEIS